MSDLDDWVDALAAELGVPREAVDVPAILDLARDAAHRVVRPAAPVSTYVAGYAAGLTAGSAARPEPTAPPTQGTPLERARDLALRWPTASAEDASPM
ncbi:molybdopterin-guanine dinucleotide biosynthesis protein [Beutenbergia cavernae DSM 12333]|uniref:Molybdopterin-guanine dinucleotide biosynthesis protein n=1 Tax=Beutenbergia cavernae (strain ATCC BAA-8 / DSM 12333 / CCUG 43141 / JCM 11478 / NBRC 16432 / NCIMB 13614 / HKI 0122) TaxID=471853 RepID=C5BYF4_BEUC1|nr:DUF6457 domain-containing protein [Beutenbergia cavernae]ACQ81054.1 molybdopterin-guanine dinucleotide biosynthesis protein [Beutenbergia cavernae DSM 12333]